jgi:hypothetical protein
MKRNPSTVGKKWDVIVIKSRRYGRVIAEREAYAVTQSGGFTLRQARRVRAEKLASLERARLTGWRAVIRCTDNRWWAPHLFNRVEVRCE